MCVVRMGIVVVVTAWCLAGCGRQTTGKPVDPTPFEAAIADYLQNQSFGMKIASVERIEPKADTATAVCRMQDAEGTYTLTVRWEFTFRRRGGGWQVESHAAK